MWGAISALGDSAANQAKKAKITTDILLIERSMDARKKAFGVAMYDYLSPLSQSQNFYAATDRLTEIVRPILIVAQKEIQALAGKRVKQKEALAAAEAQRAAAFPTKAESYGQKLVNFGKAGYLHGGETKIKTELSVTDRFIKGHKEDFGVSLYNAFASAEDNDGFLPTDRQIRNVYDTCRQDLTKLEEQTNVKRKEIAELGGKENSTSETPTLQETYTATNSTNVATGNASPANNGSSGYTNSTRYGATTTPQSAPFPTSAQKPPAAAFQVAGMGMFSHPVPTSGGFTDSYEPAGAFSNVSNQGYNNPSIASVDPFSTFMSPNSNPSMIGDAQSSTSLQQRQSADLLDF